MKRHVVLTLGRSGSNTFSDMLNQNPDVLNFGEVLGEWTRARKLQRLFQLFRRSDEAYLDWILYRPSALFLANSIRSVKKLRQGEARSVKRLRDLRSIGFKEFSLNLQRFGLSEYLVERPDIKVIGLIRDSVLDRMVSAAMLDATAVSSVRRDADAQTGRLRIAPERLVSMLEIIEDENAVLRSMLDRLPGECVYVVHYEDLYSTEARRQRILGEVFDFLEVRPADTAPRMKKIIRRPVAEIIENIDECREATRGTRFEKLLAEEGEGSDKAPASP